MKKVLFTILSLLILLFALAGCGTSNNSDIKSRPNTELPITENSAEITAEQAEQAALTHAGVTANEATFKRTELDFDDGVYKYEVEFYVGTTEYDYDIDAKTGNILSFDKDID